MRSRHIDRSFLLQILVVGLPFVLFIAHAALFADWIIDDAGISFVYSRNLAAGYGLVSQPGRLPVEGFSNPSWVVLLGLFFPVGLFDPIVTPKIVSLALILLTFLVIRGILASFLNQAQFGTMIVLTLLAVSTPFVLWTTSGLENPLYVLAVVLVLQQALGFGTEGSDRRRSAIALAALAALCALTRPDGVLYVLVLPVVLLIDVARGAVRAREAPALLLVYCGVYALLFGGYVVFRYFYFGDLFPNTYYAKGGGFSLSPYEWVLKTVALLEATGAGGLLIVLLPALVGYLIFKHLIVRRHLILGALLAIAALIYILLPLDWMPEFRFATPFFVLLYLFLAALLDTFSTSVERKRMAGAAIVALLVLLIGLSTVSSVERSQRFVQSPTIPFTYIANLYGERFNTYASEMGIEQGSFLLPDVGGTLYYSRLAVYDLGGLTDRTIARTLEKDQGKFYDYVFETLQPTFIHTHGPWTYFADFDADPRFRRDYLPIHEAVDAWVLTQSGRSLFSGDYIRKDAVRDPAALQRIRAIPVEE